MTTGTRKVKVFSSTTTPRLQEGLRQPSGGCRGVTLARDLVNEPANVLGPVEFAARAKELEALGMEVEILTEKEMKKLKMEALLGVSLGSVRPPRLAIMKWQGGKPKDKP
jgi:leucyl aminopeptidase